MCVVSSVDPIACRMRSWLFRCMMGMQLAMSACLCCCHRHRRLSAVDFINGTSNLVDLMTSSSSSASDESGIREAIAFVPRPTEDGQSSGSLGESEVPTDDESAAAMTPSAPLNVETLIVSSRFVTLRWKEPAKSRGPIVGYSVFYRQDGSER